MAKLILRLLILSLTIVTLVKCVQNACDKNCLSDILALTKNNFTALKSADSTLLSVYDEDSDLVQAEGDDNDTIKLKTKKSNDSVSWSTSHHSHNDNDLLDYMDFNEQLLMKPKVSANFAPKINANEKGNFWVTQLSPCRQNI